MGRRVCIELRQEINASCGGQRSPWRIDFRSSGCVLFNLPIGELKLSVLPFQERDKSHSPHSVTPSPLRGKVIEYLDPTEPVAEEDWELLK